MKMSDLYESKKINSEIVGYPIYYKLSPAEIPRLLRNTRGGLRGVFVPSHNEIYVGDAHVHYHNHLLDSITEEIGLSKEEPAVRFMVMTPGQFIEDAGEWWPDDPSDYVMYMVNNKPWFVYIRIPTLEKYNGMKMFNRIFGPLKIADRTDTAKTITESMETL